MFRKIKYNFEVIRKFEVPYNGVVYNSNQLFQVIRDQQINVDVGLMYMYSDNEYVHYFKDKITREYSKLEIKKYQ